MSGQAQATSHSVYRRPIASETHHSVRSRSVTPIQFRRICQALKDGRQERNIAEAEGLRLGEVVRIRQLVIERGDRQMSAIGLAFSNFAESIRAMHRDIDEGIYEELTEGAA